MSKALYRNLLQSRSWLWLRREVLYRDGNRCTRCGSGRNVEVHHLEYNGIDPCNVPIEKLTTLCGLCHRIEHGTSDYIDELAHGMGFVKW